MPFEVYKRKYPEQPFPRKFLGEFETIDNIMKTLKLTPEEIIEGLVSVTENGFEIEQTMQFLNDGLTQDEIATVLGMSLIHTKVTFHRSIKKLKASGKLKEFLLAVRGLRTRGKGYSEIRYSETITFEV